MLKDEIGLGAGAVIGIAFVWWLIAKKLNLGADSLNPASPNNVVNRVANGVFQELSGNHVDSIGTAIYGATHSDDPLAVNDVADWGWMGDPGQVMLPNDGGAVTGRVISH